MANESSTVERSTTSADGSDLGEILAGAVFPLSRLQLLQVARENGASKTLLTELHRLTQRQYFSALEAERELGLDGRARG